MSLEEIRRRHKQMSAWADEADRLRKKLHEYAMDAALDTAHQDRGVLLRRVAKLERALDAALDQCRQHAEAYEKRIAELETKLDEAYDYMNRRQGGE